MARTFELSLRPKTVLPSANPGDENKWSFAAAKVSACKNTNQIEVKLDKCADVFINSDIKLSDEDLSRITLEIGLNKPTDPENRSVFFNLKKPISVNSKQKPSHVVSVQIKGVVFDAREPISVYGGAGWPREYYFGDREGRIRRYETLREDAIGYCLLKEAVREFNMCRELRARLALAETEVPYPIGWGIYKSATDTGGLEFGFVILGHPELVPGREKQFIAAVAELTATGNFTKAGNLLARRAEAMRELNQAGVAVSFRHFGNFSLTANGRPYMHDLGDQTSLTLEDMYGHEQFLAETFAQLTYALTPRKVAIPVPGPEGTYRQTIVKHIDQYIRTTLSTYYQDDSAASLVEFEDFEATFFAALGNPLANLNLPPAILHREKVGKWLDNYRKPPEATS